MNPDFRDLLAPFLAADVRFLVVGAHAMAVHGIPRANEGLDVWIAPDPENAEHAWSAVVRFGAPLSSVGVTRADFGRPEQFVQIGLPPRRIDILPSIGGVAFDDAWPDRVVHEIEGLADLEALGERG